MRIAVRASRRAMGPLLSIVLFALVDWSVGARAAEKIGIVLMHGEQGAPGRVIDGLGHTLEKAGYLVGRPDMCWSARRSYEAPFSDCLAAVDSAIVKLRNLGATSIVVAGYSLGGNAAIAYGADHAGLLGIVGVAPAHDARAAAENKEVADSIAQARQMLAEGKGDDEASFADVAIGPTGAYATEIATSAKIYLSFFGPDASANIPDSVAKLKAPLLWIAGTDDPTQKGGRGYAFARAPANSLNRYVSVPGSHGVTPDAAREPMMAWLKTLAGN